MKTKVYLAYGSNLNIAQMRYRCPLARPLATTILKGWELTFRGNNNHGVATIEKNKDSNVAALLWQITSSCEKSLDIYEGFPHLYRKETLTVKHEGKTIKTMVYILNEGPSLASPSASYFNTILSGYRSCNLDETIFFNAVHKTMEAISE